MAGRNITRSLEVAKKQLLLLRAERLDVRASFLTIPIRRTVKKALPIREELRPALEKFTASFVQGGGWNRNAARGRDLIEQAVFGRRHTREDLKARRRRRDRKNNRAFPDSTFRRGCLPRLDRLS